MLHGGISRLASSRLLREQMKLASMMMVIEKIDMVRVVVGGQVG